jgi:hypothetical protein
MHGWRDLLLRDCGALDQQGCPCGWLGGTFTRIVTAAENIRRRPGKIEEVGTELDHRR